MIRSFFRSRFFSILLDSSVDGKTNDGKFPTASFSKDPFYIHRNSCSSVLLYPNALLPVSVSVSVSVSVCKCVYTFFS